MTGIRGDIQLQLEEEEIEDDESNMKKIENYCRRKNIHLDRGSEV